MSLWQIRNALEMNRIIPVFVAQVLLGCQDGVCEDGRRQREPYQSLLQDLEETAGIRGDFRIFNLSLEGQSNVIITRELIGIIQQAYSVSICMSVSQSW